MKHFNYPKKSAYMLGRDMRRFLHQTENTAYSELNNNADADRVEVIRQIDWAAFNQIVNQLEFSYLQQKKNKR